MNNKLKFAIIGCGNRSKSYINILSSHAEASLDFLCDSYIDRAQDARQTKELGEIRVTDSLDDVLSNRDIDAVIICTPDSSHCEIACDSLRAGKHVLLEKPMGLNLEDCRKIKDTIDACDAIFSLAFTLRTTPFYHRIHQLISSGVIGQIMGIEAAEHVGDQHGASYMRRWQRNSSLSGGLIANKCSHDIDILRWIVNSPASKVSSFGGRDYFNPDKLDFHPTHCSSCKIADTCKYKYNGSHVNPTEEMSQNPAKYDLDLCVYTSEKDIVDNQVVTIEYANKVRATFSVQMFNIKSDRTIHISGTEGYIDGCFSKNQIEIYRHGREIEIEDISESAIGSHGGGDRLLLQSFIHSVNNGTTSASMASSDDGIENTLTWIAIERARKESQIVNISDVGTFL